VFESRHHLLLVRFALHKVIVVIAPIANQLALSNLHNVANELV
jgi:hypothetical protein